MPDDIFGIDRQHEPRDQVVLYHWRVYNNGCEVLICSKNGAPGAIPTRDLSLRRRALYATELREQANRVNSIQQTADSKKALILHARMKDHVSG